MRYITLLLFIVACGKAPTAPVAPPPPPPPAPPLDPPVAVHVINQRTAFFNAWTLIIGADSGRTGIAAQGSVYPDTSIQFPGPFCLRSAAVPGQRLLVEIAVVPNSALESALAQISNADAAGSLKRDSLSRGTLLPATLLARASGLITATAPFDPVPAGFTFPPDTVPWTWTVQANGATTIIIDRADRACRP